jgi:hypothetical protein
MTRSPKLVISLPEVTVRPDPVLLMVIAGKSTSTALVLVIVRVSRVPMAPPKLILPELIVKVYVVADPSMVLPKVSDPPLVLKVLESLVSVTAPPNCSVAAPVAAMVDPIEEVPATVRVPVVIEKAVVLLDAVIRLPFTVSERFPTVMVAPASTVRLFTLPSVGAVVNLGEAPEVVITASSAGPGTPGLPPSSQLFGSLQSFVNPCQIF